jgi:hypothetical protein
LPLRSTRGVMKLGKQTAFTVSEKRAYDTIQPKNVKVIRTDNAPSLLRESADGLGCSVMSKPAQKQQALRRLFPKLAENEVENLARYFDVALEIASQDSSGAERAFDNSPSIPNLKERSSSNLKHQS